jgi:hypothetical protein
MAKKQSMTPHTILGVHITERVKEAVEVQRHLTCFGRFIKTRLGLHDITKTSESPNGLILLEVCAPAAKVKELMKSLNAIQGVEVKSMVFEH